MTDVDLSAWFMAGIGGILLLWQRRRRFKRLNQYGVEQFSSFTQKIGSRILDGALQGLGFLLVAGSAILLLLENTHTIPLSAFVVIGGGVALFEHIRGKKK